MNPIMFSVGSFSVRWYSFFIALAVCVAFVLIYKESKRFDLPKDFLFNLVFYSVIIGIIGARFYYVIFNFSLYKNDFLSIFKIWEGGLAIHGGLIAGFITMAIYCYKKKVRLFKMTDMVAPVLLIAQAIGRWGNFFNSEAHGGATTYEALKNINIPEFIINGMKIGGIYYKPTFFYESIWCVIGFIILLILRRNKHIHIGELSCLYLIWYSVGRLFIEAMRTDSLMFLGFKVAQIVSVILIIVGIGGMIYLRRKSKYEDLYNDKDNGIVR